MVDYDADDTVAPRILGLKLQSFICSISSSLLSFSRFSFLRSASCSSLSGRGRVS